MKMLITSEKVPVDLFKIFSTVPFKSGPRPEKNSTDSIGAFTRVLYKGILQNISLVRGVLFFAPDVFGKK